MSSEFPEIGWRASGSDAPEAFGLNGRLIWILKLFWTQVGNRSNTDINLIILLLFSVENTREAKVGNNGVARTIQQDILGFEIPVIQTIFVSLFQSTENLNKVFEYKLQRGAFVLIDEPPQITGCRVLSDNKRILALRIEVDDLGNIRMVEASLFFDDGLEFTDDVRLLEVREDIENSINFFDSNRTVEFTCFGSIDRPNAPRSNLVERCVPRRRFQRSG